MRHHYKSEGHPFPKHHHWTHGHRTEHKHSEGPWVVQNESLGVIGDEEGPWIYDNKEFALEEAHEETEATTLPFDIKDVSSHPPDAQWSDKNGNLVAHKDALKRIRSKP